MNEEMKTRIAARIAERKSLGLTAGEFDRRNDQMKIDAKIAIEQEIASFCDDSLRRMGSKLRCQVVRGLATIR